MNEIAIKTRNGLMQELITVLALFMWGRRKHKGGMGVMESLLYFWEVMYNGKKSKL